MTLSSSDLRALCDSLNDERGTGGQTRLAGMLKWDASTIRRKLSGKSRITYADELAIRAVLADTIPDHPAER
jgi:hypothetical protein